MNEKVLADIEKEINKVNTHLCSKYYYKNVNGISCAYCKENNKCATCFGMQMFCPFEEWGYIRGAEEISKNELKTKMSSVLENEMKMKCEHYLNGSKHCLQCRDCVECNGDRQKCELPNDKRMEELVIKAMTY